MDRETPLIITATPNICWLRPEVEYPRTPEEMAAEASRCREAGASILHMHADDWPGTIAAVRAATDVIVQCGMSSLPIPERTAVFEQRADMISIITSHHDEAFAEHDVHALHPREELLEYAALQRSSGVRLEYEIWHTRLDLEPEVADRAGRHRSAVLHEHLLRLAGRLLVAAHGRGVRLPSPPPPGGVRRHGEHHGSAPDGHRDGRDRRGRPRPRRHRGPAARARRSIGDDPRVGRRGRGGGSRAG